ncbi:hypothetical protein [Pseudomonas pharyngis]|uniref:hypothetical protein n=1 Tax=Pseudomonas pharyngis TaxID=2892333 RepID=UPI001F17F495|nr:hypothetical protein [Pseudomonas pharyngis]
MVDLTKDFVVGTRHKITLLSGQVVEGLIESVTREGVVINDLSDGKPKDVLRENITDATAITIQGKGFLGDKPSPNIEVGSGSGGASGGHGIGSGQQTQWHGYGCKCGCGGFGTYAYGAPVY